MEAVCLPSRSSREQSEGWRPGLDLNQDKEHCTALASTLPPPGRIHLSRSAPAGPLLVAVNPTSLRRLRLLRLGRPPRSEGCLGVARGAKTGPLGSLLHVTSDGRATKVMRQGLWPILTATREAVKPLVASLATMSASL